MANWGIETWDEQGRNNNLGIRPFLFSRVVNLSQGQTGSWSIALSPGTKAAYMFIPSDGTQYPTSTDMNRIISANGSTITVTTASDSTINNETNAAGYLYIFMVSL